MKNAAPKLTPEQKEEVLGGTDPRLTNVIDHANRALHRAVAEAELQETKPKFNLGFSISIDPDKGNYETKLSWTVKQSLSIEHTIEDTNQAKLPLEGTAINTCAEEAK